jgi:hypothetical protein
MTMNKTRMGLSGVVGLIVILAGCVQISQPEASVQDETPTTEQAEFHPTPTTAAETMIDGDEHSVEEAILSRQSPSFPELPQPENQLSEGDYRWSQLLGRDSIAPVYNPQFASAAEAPYDDDELVIGVEINGEAKAYAIGPLNAREMVNDELAGIPILVTW